MSRDPGKSNNGVDEGRAGRVGSGSLLRKVFSLKLSTSIFQFCQFFKIQEFFLSRFRNLFTFCGWATGIPQLQYVKKLHKYDICQNTGGYNAEMMKIILGRILRRKNYVCIMNFKNCLKIKFWTLCRRFLVRNNCCRENSAAKFYLLEINKREIRVCI